MDRGREEELTRSELYPRFRWHFAWRHYVVIGIPDGLPRDFIYEFKRTEKQFFFLFTKPVALAQADLYGKFFCRSRKRVQIHIGEIERTETYDLPVDHARAEDTLCSFANVDAGKPPRPPKDWKCRSCDFRTTCPISQAG